MHIIRLALGCAILTASSGCGKPPITLKKIGEACAVDSDCGSTLNGQPASMLCRDAVCTKICVGQNDCPQGFDCGRAHPGDTDATCYPSPMGPAQGGFGTDCSTVAPDPKTNVACTGQPTPCANGFVCRSSLKCDPKAYCTTHCALDTDCPPTFFCDTDKDGSHFCLKRTYCADCLLDDQCETTWVCATDGTGGRFCAKPCGSDTDCPQPQNGNSEFQKCIADKGGKGKICQPAPIPKSGSSAPNLCHGPSAIKQIATVGGVCSGCRPGVPSDCAMGGFCYVDEFTTEHFCSEACTFGGGVDSCPAGATCLVVAAGNPAKGYCTGDPLGMYLTCYP